MNLFGVWVARSLRAKESVVKPICLCAPLGDGLYSQNCNALWKPFKWLYNKYACSLIGRTTVSKTVSRGSSPLGHVTTSKNVGCWWIYSETFKYKLNRILTKTEIGFTLRVLNPSDFISENVVNFEYTRDHSTKTTPTGQLALFNKIEGSIPQSCSKMDV